MFCIAIHIHTINFNPITNTTQIKSCKYCVNNSRWLLLLMVNILSPEVVIFITIRLIYIFIF